MSGYTTMNPEYLSGRSPRDWSSPRPPDFPEGLGTWTEQCWRDTLAIFDEKVEKQKMPKVSTYCCNQIGE
jgi:hypothetical protein